MAETQAVMSDLAMGITDRFVETADRQREEAFADIRAERMEVLQALREEREAVLVAIREERLATLDGLGEISLAPWRRRTPRPGGRSTICLAG